MRSLLDTNIIIHREAVTTVNQDIGILFKWLDKTKYEKCVHPLTVAELQKHGDKKMLDSLRIKLQNYSVLKTTAPIALEVQALSKQMDMNDNDRNDTLLLNEVFCGRVDILISEDKKNPHKSYSPWNTEPSVPHQQFLGKSYLRASRTYRLQCAQCVEKALW